MSFIRPHTADPRTLYPSRTDRIESARADRQNALDDELCTLSNAITDRSFTDIRLVNVLGRLQERVENGSASHDQAAAARKMRRLLVRVDKLVNSMAADLEYRA